MSLKAISPSIKNNFFHQCMVIILNELELRDQKYQTNGIVTYNNYKGNILFPVKEFVSFGIDRQ